MLTPVGSCGGSFAIWPGTHVPRISTSTGFERIYVEQGWVFATLSLASMIMLSSRIFASRLLVQQIGVPVT
jgi:hypothetical protein